MIIGPFEGEYKFLSNFYPSIITHDGFVWPTVEHAYQACKTSLIKEKRIILRASTPAKAKQLGKTVTLRDDWGDVKLYIMEQLLRKKFENESLQAKLIKTEGIDLCEINTWGDTFWGVCNDVGENHLGKLLMKIRYELIK